MTFSHQSVRLISHSKTAPDGPGAMDMQELVAYCARVSNPANQNNLDTSEKLVRYLVKHKHWSPLEMVSATVEINTTRDIARQILRHRSFSFQEFSQRYADPTAALEMIVRDARLQDTKNRQNSVVTDDENLKIWWKERQKELIELSESIYKDATARGIAKEQARSILPEGCTMSRLYMAGTLRSFVHFIEVRSGNGTQAECMDIARKIAVSITPIFPMVKEFVQPKVADSQGDTK